MTSVRKVLILFCLISVALTSFSPLIPEIRADSSFSFAFAGDTGQYGASAGSGQNGTGSFFNTAASLQALPPGLSFFVDDGDISYNGTSNNFPSTGNEILWSNLVIANFQG